MRRMLVTCLVVVAGLSGPASPALAGFFSSTGPIIAILAGDLFLGVAEGNLDGSGTLSVRSRIKPDVTCRGQFIKTSELGGEGNMQCSDGATATFQFQRLSLVRGYGTGNSSRGSMSFTYGLTAQESAPYLKLPPGKALMPGEKDLALVDVSQTMPAMLPVSSPVAPATGVRRTCC